MPIKWGITVSDGQATETGESEPMKCPHCGNEIDLEPAEAAKHMGRSTSEAKAKAARLNGMKGGRPRKEKPEKN